MGSFGEEHRKLRLKNTDITLRLFAKRLKVSPAYVSNVENSIEPPFSEDMLRKSARLMNLSIQEEAMLFELRKEGAKKSTVEKLAYQVARKASHLSEREFEEFVRHARKLIQDQKRKDDKK
jgi:transcriptional regulator with XRE-family HTH domain